MGARSLALASISGVTLLTVEVVASFIVTPILLRGLGAEQYGAWDILIGLIGYFGFLDMGVGAAILRYVAHTHGGASRNEGQIYLATGFWSLAVLGLVGALAVSVMVVLKLGWFGTDVDALQSLPTLTVVVALLIGLSLPLNALSSYLLGRQQNVGLNFLRMCLAITRASLAIWVATSDTPNRLLLLSQCFLVLLVCEILILAAWVVRIEGIRALRLTAFSIRHAKDLLSYGSSSTLLMLGTGSLRRVVGIVIAKTVGLSQVVHYAVANRLVEYSQSFAMAVGYPLTAHLSRIAAESDPASLRRAYLESTKLVQFFSLGIPIGLFWMGEPFLRRWLGDEFTAHAQGLLAILCLALLFQGVASNSNRLLFALARHRGVAVFSAITAPVLIAVSIPLTRTFGVYGAAAAVALHGMVNAIVEIRSAEKALGIGSREALNKTALPYVLPLVAMSVVLAALKFLRYPDSYVLIAAYCATGFLAYLLVVSLVAYRESPLVLARRLLAR